MTAWGTAALAIAIFGAFSYAAASILQAMAAGRSTGTVRTMGHPLYLLGICCDMLAWFGSMVALQHLAVYLVESILAGSLALTVAGARLFLATPLRKRDATAIFATLLALTVLALSAGTHHDTPATTGLRLVFCATAVTLALLGWLATRLKVPGGGVAALAGLSMGGAALIGRVLPIPSGEGAWAVTLAIVTEPLTAALLVFAATGMTLYAYALQNGQVGPVTAVHWTAEVVTPSVVALVFLGDTIRTGWGPAATAAGLVTVGAAVLLARAPANEATVRAVEALPAAPQPAAIEAAPAPTPDRVIWWGPPPIWVPPTRARVAPPPPAQLTWTPAPRPWSDWRAPTRDRAEAK